MTAEHQFKRHFRKDYGSDDYRRVYDEHFNEAIEADEQAEQLHRQWVIQLKVRNAICYGPKESFDRDRYEYRRRRMRELEIKIAEAKHCAQFHRDIWNAMEPPKPGRPRKTVVIDGVRTKIEREDA